MSIFTKAGLALAVALAATAPGASAQTVCQTAGGDQASPLRSTACVSLDRPAPGTYTVSTGCSLLGDQLRCAIEPVTVSFIPTP